MIDLVVTTFTFLLLLTVVFSPLIYVRVFSPENIIKRREKDYIKYVRNKFKKEKKIHIKNKVFVVQDIDYSSKQIIGYEIKIDRELEGPLLIAFRNDLQRAVIVAQRS